MKTKEGMIGQLFKSGGFSVEIGDKIVGMAENAALCINGETKLEMDWSPSPIKLTGTAKIDGNDSLLEDLLSGMSFNVDTTIFPKVKLPRKIKKAGREFYWRNTKWRRKWDRYIIRARRHYRGGEMILTKDEAGRLKAVIEFGKNVLVTNKDGSKVSADTLLKALLEKKSHGTGNRPSKATT